MELKRSQQNWLPLITKKIWDHRVRRFLVIGLYTCLAFSFGYYVHRSGYSYGQTLRPLINDIRTDLNLMPKKVQANLSKPSIDHITIDINHNNFMKLAYQREIALARGMLLSGDDDFVPATIQHNGETVNVKLRLKGDFADHLEGDKWSFRIKVSGDDALFGMKQFSIQHPRTRKYIYEWLFHQALKREGVISLRYQFINVTLNGKNLGIYAVEEHFEKRLPEHNQLRAGPIVRFNDELRWTERFHQRPHIRKTSPHNDSLFLRVDIDTFQTDQMLSDPSNFAQHTQAIYLLEAFRRGELETREVFDIQKLAKFYAITDLMGAQHSTSWGNIRFYYNPITSRLEPIGFDGDSGLATTVLSKDNGPHFGPVLFEMLFSDKRFLEEYMATLERISEPAYLDRLLAELNDELQQNLNVIYSEFPDFNYSEGIFYQNQHFIRKTLGPVKGMHAHYHQASKNQLELELGNIHSMPLEVLSVSYQDSVEFQPVQKVILAETPVLQPEPVDYQIVGFTFPKDFVWSETMIKDLKVNYKLVGTTPMRQETVFPWSYLDDYFVDNDFIRQEPNVHAFDFLVTDDSTQEIFIKPGSWHLDQSLIIPAGYRVIGGPSTQLDLSNSAKILSYSPLEFIGSEEEPIVIQSTDATGQGIVILNAEQTSILERVIFNNLSNPAQNGWELTGAVTFYESPVKISQTHFVGNRSEDGLNIVRSEYSIDNSLFSQTFSDAFDADFANGKITNSTFRTSGNDAIDVSGSVLEIQDVFIDGSGDKGLSAGENSQVTVNRIEIENAEIGVASKDLSEVNIRNISISDSNIGLTAYQKKSEFGGALIDVQRLKMERVNTPYLIEKQSGLQVDNEMINNDQNNVYLTLYGTE